MHTGRPVIRQIGTKLIAVLCPYGHVIHAIQARDWAGSWLESRASDMSWTVDCDGAL